VECRADIESAGFQETTPISGTLCRRQVVFFTSAVSFPPSLLNTFLSRALLSLACTISRWCRRGEFRGPAEVQGEDTSRGHERGKRE